MDSSVPVTAEVSSSQGPSTEKDPMSMDVPLQGCTAHRAAHQVLHRMDPDLQKLRSRAWDQGLLGDGWLGQVPRG